MPPVALNFLKRWVITTLAVLVAAKCVDGIHYDSWGSLVVASLALGFLNAFVRPVLLILSLPLLVASLGFFFLILNALLLWAVGSVIKGFHVDGFGDAFWGALVMGFVSIAVGFLVGGRSRFQVRGGQKPSDTGSGPVINV